MSVDKSKNLVFGWISLINKSLKKEHVHIATLFGRNLLGQPN